MGNSVGARSCVGPAVGWDACSKVGAGGGGTVAVGAATTGGEAGAGAAHAANSTANRLKVVKRRVFIIMSFRQFITENPYEKINAQREKCVAPASMRRFQR